MIDFPSNPTIGQIYSYNGYSWQWNGSYWKSYTLSLNYLSLSGGTVTGPTNFTSGLTANTISATTYQNLPVSGLTAGQNINISGTSGNFTISFTGTTGSSFTGGTVSGATNFINGLSADTISATTYQNLPTDVRVTGATYSNNTFTYTNNTGGTFNVLFDTLTGLTVNGNLSVTGTTSSNVISATTYQNLPQSATTFITGFSYNNNTFSIRDNSGSTFNSIIDTVTGFTVNGNMNITGTTSTGVISATTYQNLPISGLTEGSNISITGSNGNFTVSVTGITSGGSFTGNTSASCVNDFYVSNIFGCDEITLQSSIQTVGSTVNGTLSHAEGTNTSVGTTLAYSGTVVNGLISLDPIYGDLTAEFVSGDYLFLDDSQFDAIYGKVNLLIDTVNYTTQTDIQLVDTSVTSTTVYVVSTVNFTSWVGDKTIYSDYSHAEGAGNLTINDYSHSEGRFTASFGRGSHAEGFQNVSIGQYSHSEGVVNFAIGDFSHAEGEEVKSVGNYSHAEGQNSISTGEHSHAEGRGTQSIGVFSHSEGRETESIGNGSHAEGYLTDSVGNFSHSEGFLNQSVGDYSHSEGRNSISLGVYSHAEGRSISSGDTSHAEGEFTKSIGIGSHSEGGYSNSGYLGYSGNSFGQTITLNSTYGDLTPLFSGATAVVILDDSKFDNINGVTSIGVTANTYNGTNTVLIAKTPISSTTTCIITLPNNPNPTLADITNGGGSHSEGFYTGTHGVGSHAEGYSGRSYGDYSHVEGLNSRTFGKYSHAEGGGTTYADNSHAEGLGASFGQYSHAEGGGNSLGQYSHAEGGGMSYGDYSHAQGGGITYGAQSFAQGSGSVASGNSSSAIGYFTITSTDYQIALGKLNTTGNTTSLLVIGNGTSSINRSDLALFNPNGIIFNAPLTATTISASTYLNLTKTGQTTVDFGFTGGGESDYATTVVSNTNILQSSMVMYSVIASNDHQQTEDSLLDGLTFKTSDIIDGVSFTVNCYSLNNTWGSYNVFYKIIN